MRVTRRPLTIEAASIPPMRGSRSNPETVAEAPVTSCMYSGRKMMAPKIVMARKNVVALATLKTRLLNSSSGRIGSLARRCSHQAKATSRPTPASAVPMIGADPLDGPEGDELQHVLADARQDRAGEEDEDGGLEEALAPVEVRELAVERCGRGGRHQVGGHDPGKMTDAAQVAGDRRQGRGDD